MKNSIPPRLLERLASIAETDRRKAMYVVEGVTNVKNLFKYLIRDIETHLETDDIQYTWFRMDDNKLAVVISGARCVISYMPLFMMLGPIRGLYADSHKVWEGTSNNRFTEEAYRLLNKYQSPIVAHQHSYGAGR